MTELYKQPIFNIEANNEKTKQNSIYNAYKEKLAVLCLLIDQASFELESGCADNDLTTLVREIKSLSDELATIRRRKDE